MQEPSTKEHYRDRRGLPALDTLLQDLRFGLRILCKSPGFTAIAVLTLALGIGASTAIFSVVNAVVLEPLPYSESSRLVMVWEKVHLPSYQNDESDPASGNFADWRRQNSVFEDLAAIQDKSFNLTGDAEPIRVEGEAVSASLFSLLRVRPELGRVFTNEEDVPGAANVVLMGHGLWVNGFGADAKILNKSILLDGVSYTVIGIMPPNFRFPDPANFRLSAPEDQLWIPIALSPAALADHNSHNLQGVLGRLKAHVKPVEGQAEMSAIARRLAEEYPNSNTGVSASLTPLRERLVGDTESSLWILLGAVTLILLMVCANVASLLLARASTRGREMGVRIALGASRSRILRQLLTENVLLALFGGALGLLFSVWAVHVLLSIGPSNLPHVGEFGLNGSVLAFSLGISLLTGLIFGTTPALLASRGNVQNSLGEAARGSAPSARLRTRSLVMIAQTALGVVVVIGAALLLRSYLRLGKAPLGFEPRHLLTFRVIPRGHEYAHPSQRATFYQQALTKIGSVAGVKSAAAVSFLPLGFVRFTKGFSLEGRPPFALGEMPVADYDAVSPGYFATMNTAVLEGRDFSRSDGPQSRPVIIINQAMAQAYWPTADPLEKRLKQGVPDAPAPWLTVVGVVGNIREFDVGSEPRPTIYFPVSQLDAGSAWLRDWVVRTRGNPLSVAAAVRHAVWSVDKNLAVSRVQTMDQVRNAALAPQLFNLSLLGLFAGIALLLASVGLYSVVSYAVAQRTREIGIRMALGARPRDVLGSVVLMGGTLALIGVAIGLSAALGLTRLMSALLYGVSPADPVAYVGVTVLLVGISMGACFVPAYRASRVDPMVALRNE